MKNKTMTLGSLFDGSGGFPLGGMIAGIEPRWSSEIEPYPILVTHTRFPQVKHYGDVSKLNGAELEPVDVITFGSPCFPEGTLVMTEEGYLPIEDVEVGMKVLTHNGRWRKVTQTGAKFGETVLLQGNHYGLECTPNHPVYSCGEKKYYPRLGDGKRGNITLLTEKREWVPAGEMKGRLWAVPNRVEELPISSPELSWSYRMKQAPSFSDELFYFVGRWLGDGWVVNGQRSGRPKGQTYGKIYLCDSLDKEQELRSTVSCLTDKYMVEYCGNTVKVYFISTVLADWLTDNFGRYAAGKTMPGWVFGMKESYRAALLRGLMDSDGCPVSGKDNSWKVATVSKRLAESIRLLGEIQGYSTTVNFTKTPDTTEIEGRTVAQRDWYCTVLTKGKKRKHLRDELHGWYRVRKCVHTNSTKVVYNLTVEEDNSYVADGIVVHNCQDLSIAGKRAGIQDGERSSLFFEAIRIIKEMREATNGEKPRYCVWENVPGAFSSNKGEDFKAVLEAVVSVKEEGVEVPAPENNRWAKADVLLGPGFSVAYRVLDAQYWGVAQRRARIYLVADFNGESAGEILFKSEGLSGYTPQGFRSWQGTPSCSEGGSGEAGGRSDAGSGGRLVLNTQGQSGVSITEDQTGTLIAQDHGNHPAVLDTYAGAFHINVRSEGIDLHDVSGALMAHQSDQMTTFITEKRSNPKSAGFCTEHSAQARGIGYEEEKSPTLRAGVVPAALKEENPAFALENHPADSRVKISEDGKVQTLCSRMGTGGGNVPLVAEPEPTPKTLKIRCGKEGGGKGPLIQEDMSATLATNNDQTLFQPTKPEIKAYGVCSKSSHSMMSDNPHSGFYEAETSRTLDCNGGNPTSNQGGIAILAFAENQRSEVRDLKDKAGALAAQPGMKQQTFVAFEPGAASRVGGHVYADGKTGTLRANAGDNAQAVAYSLQGNMIGRKDENGPQGAGVNEEVSFTLNTTDRHAVAFAEKSATLSANDGPKGPSSQQLGNPEENFVAEEKQPAYGLDRTSFNSGVKANYNFCVEEELEPTMVSRGPNAVSHPTYSTSKNSYHTTAIKEQASTLVASDYKDPPCVNDTETPEEKEEEQPMYIVRRLTPTECARLQGFPDWWCDGLAIPDPTDEELAFWTDVWNTWQEINGKPAKTEKQVRKWLADPYSDSAEYKLWGNGISLPVVFFVLSGVKWAYDKDSE